MSVETAETGVETERPVLRGAGGRLLPGTGRIPGNGRKPRHETDARTELARGLYVELRDDFEQNGRAAIERMREERPAEYIKVIASLAPKQLQLDGGEVTFIEILQIVEQRARSTGTIVEHAPESDSPAPQATFDLPPLPDDPLEGIGS